MKWACFLNIYDYTHRRVLLSTLIREASLCAGLAKTLCWSKWGELVIAERSALHGTSTSLPSKPRVHCHSGGRKNVRVRGWGGAVLWKAVSQAREGHCAHDFKAPVTTCTRDQWCSSAGSGAVIASLMTWVRFLGPTKWKERPSCRKFSVTSVYASWRAHVCVHSGTHKIGFINIPSQMVHGLLRPHSFLRGYGS